MNIQNLYDLSGKTALITGASRGIGQAVAVAMACCGADIICVSNNFPEGSEAEKAAKAYGRHFSKYSIDFSSREAVYHFLKELKEKENPVDILVNNAGTIVRKPLAEHDDDTWDKVLSVNLHTQFILARELGKEMVARKKGKIIFTCSMLSYQGGINVASYTASKSAVAGVIKAFANEWASSGVNINGIAPGYIATDNTAALQSDAVRSKAILERIPAARWGTPEDMAAPYVFLAAAASDYVNGTILNVDGGWMGR
ncbi:SDR family NAD(P)-dependent oxidoreductase [Haoranjiania flava]|uniref:SDR family NAD(P)-dependent oxidoreductase n=1 Tax=Haoranjiania flava TaxID=1856322 RepID=UPI00294FFB40|nr:SDR family NAD(P)-dependent oxidoreductase [Haoranjiania flava]